jgi:hypothetical protein
MWDFLHMCGWHEVCVLQLACEIYAAEFGVSLLISAWDVGRGQQVTATATNKCNMRDSTAIILLVRFYAVDMNELVAVVGALQAWLPKRVYCNSPELRQTDGQP